MRWLDSKQKIATKNHLSQYLIFYSRGTGGWLALVSLVPASCGHFA